MKKIFVRMLSLFAVASLLLVFANCGGDDPKAPAEKGQLEKLSQTWNIVSADLDGTDRTSDFTGFTLTISGTFNSSSPEGPYDYAVSGSRPTPSPWPSSGTWTFGSIGTGDSGQIIRDDGVGIDYVISSSGQLTFTFTCSTCDYPGARTEQVNGDWTFALN